MIDRKIVKDFFNEIFYVHIVGAEDVYSDINCTIRTNNKKVKGLAKLIGRTLVGTDSIVGFEDVVQVVASIILEMMLYLKINRNMSEEEFIELFLHMSDKCETKTDIESARLYKLLETKCKQWKYKADKVEDRAICANVHGIDIDVKNFNEFKITDSKGKESTIEEVIEAITFNKNEMFIEEENVKLQIEKWIEDNKVKLSENERRYLTNPLDISCATSRPRYQKRIEDKLRTKAIQQFGTSNSKIIELLLEKQSIEQILDSEDTQGAIVNSLDYISSFNSYYELPQEVRMDIVRAFNFPTHKAQNKSLILVCEILHDRLEKLTEALGDYKIDTPEKEEVIKKKATKFIMKDIPNINLEENEEFPKSIKGEAPANYQKFKNLHKKVFQENLKLDVKYYNWLYFANHLKKSEVADTRYYIYIDSDGEVYFLPEEFNRIFQEAKPQFDKRSKKYKGNVKFEGKNYSGGLTENYDKAYQDLIMIKNDLLQEAIIPSYGHLVSNDCLSFLKSFKFELK
ncbi:MAG: hypothetical protein V8R03_04515 [Clostridium sp.]